MVEHIVTNIPGGKMLKSYLVDLYPNLKPSIIEKALKKGDIKVNNTRQRKNVLLAGGDNIKVYLTDEELGVNPPLEIVYEDENLLIINKIPGISCIDDKLTGTVNIVSLAEAHMKQKGDYNRDLLNVPFLCHRLDHHTGGLLVIAKHEHANEFIMDAFAERRIRKFYQAIVCGKPQPPQSQLHDFLLKDAAASKVKIFKNQIKNSVPVVTRYATLSSNEELTRLEIELVTGRTHQIRAHLSFYGHPVLGDDKYGNRKINKKFNASYQVLWATRLIFNIGTGHFMEYLNKKVFETDHIEFPTSVMKLEL